MTTARNGSRNRLLPRAATRLAAPFVLAAAFHREPRWASYRRPTLAIGIAAFLAELAGFSDVAAPVTLRLALGLWLAWIALTGARVLTEARLEQLVDYPPGVRVGGVT